MLPKKIRLVNFIIDSSLFMVLLILIVYATGDRIAKEHLKWIAALIYTAYYFLLESFTGKTIGKMVTRSKVIAVKNTPQNHFVLFAIRTLLRLLPIDIFSYLFTPRGLHDRFSLTETVRDQPYPSSPLL
ncbi:MAG: RDD family protein [Chitinophagaceae bacterium]